VKAAPRAAFLLSFSFLFIFLFRQSVNAPGRKRKIKIKKKDQAQPALDASRSPLREKRDPPGSFSLILWEGLYAPTECAQRIN
jgi:hypothetical protein